MASRSDERKPATVLFADLVGSTELATARTLSSSGPCWQPSFDEMREQTERFKLSEDLRTVGY